MVDIHGMKFMLFFVGMISLSIILVIVFSTKKVIKNKKENQETNPLYILLIVFGLLFLFNNLIDECMIPLVTIIIGIVGNIYNLKNKQNKYFVLGFIVYSLMILYGLRYLYYLCK
ncbi:MAG: hypothetical protein HFJ55_01460 [Clostridia bacterium]|nr:hypothetical protein [Clostridia bacterium]